MSDDIKKYRSLIENANAPEFVDVSDMSDRDVKRMGHADETGPMQYAYRVQSIAFFKIPFGMKDEFKADIKAHSDSLSFIFNGKDGKYSAYPNHWGIVFYTRQWLKEGQRPEKVNIYEVKFSEELRGMLAKYKNFHVGSEMASYKQQ